MYYVNGGKASIHREFYNVFVFFFGGGLKKSPFTSHFAPLNCSSAQKTFISKWGTLSRQNGEIMEKDCPAPATKEESVTILLCLFYLQFTASKKNKAFSSWSGRSSVIDLTFFIFQWMRFQFVELLVDYLRVKEYNYFRIIFLKGYKDKYCGSEKY